PALMKYWDVTYIQKNTIPEEVQEFMPQLDDEVTFTLYVNLLDSYFKVGMPAFRMNNYAMLKPFIRFKPDIKLDYVYYYDDCDNMRPDLMRSDMSVQDKMLKICREEDLDADDFLTPEQIRERIDLSEEGNRLVYLVERKGGGKVFLRFFNDNNYIPSEKEIATVLKRLVAGPAHVCFLTGHGERSIVQTGDQNYYLLVVRNDRSSLSNQGFDFGIRTLTGMNKNLEGVDILVIADPQEEYTPEELQKIDTYLAEGGNALVTGEMCSRGILNRLLEKTGVRLDSVFVHQQELPDYAPELIPGDITELSITQLGLGKGLHKHRKKVVLDGCLALERDDSDFECIPVVVAPVSGRPLVMALRRTIQGKEQRILIAGDADLFSAGEIRRERMGINSGNFNFMTGVFSWLANDEYPLDMSRPEAIDDTLYLSVGMFGVVKVILMWGIPLLIAVVAGVVLLRRKRK
ncbi:MAG: GldG family protein, partial [Odoribacter sp.]|nr:GldG family protein [Odoribacter sp.]